MRVGDRGRALFVTEPTASSGDSAPVSMRRSSSETSSSKASNRRVKKASASAAGTSGTCPTARSPAERADVHRAVGVHPSEGGRAQSFRPSMFGHSSILPDSLDSLELVLIASFPAGPWQTNCYLVAATPGAECVIIDPGLGAVAGVTGLIMEHRLKPVAVMLTHGHLDHMFSVTPLCRSYDSTCWVHPGDRVLLSDPLRAMGLETRQLLEQLDRQHGGFTRAGRGAGADGWAPT